MSDWASLRGIPVPHDGEQRSRGTYLDVYTPNDQSRAQTRETIKLFERNRRTMHGNREFKRIATAGATTAAVTEKVWGEYVAAVCQILAK